MAAASIAVTVSMGAMKPVLEKLATLLGDKYKRVMGVRKEVSFLVEELSEMKTLLEKMGDVADELDPQAKKWRKDIIDMSYDIEDCIDNFMDRVGKASDKVGFLKKASGFLRTFMDRYRIGNQIKEIKSCVFEASKRRERYNFNVSTSSTTTPVAVDPRLSALYKDSATLVGIDTQKEELVKWVMGEDKHLKVMPIVGFGGLGKTTLANVVYQEVKGQFNSKAFLPVSQKLDVPKFLHSVCSKLGVPSSSHASDEVHDLINTLIEYLRDKRYLIVLDDLWNVRDWDIISLAFPRNNQQSRLIVTTRIEGVAQACRTDHGHIHYMKPLSEVDSRKLFFRRIFGPDKDTCPPQFIEVPSEILKKCGGLPLAIVTLASILAEQHNKEHWDDIQRSIVTESAANSLDDMMHILDLSYKHLAHHLRACFLYLGIYPEDYSVRRDELINLWVAERIVMSNSPEQDVRDVAESYFNQLVNKNLIQPAESGYGYRVHDMMRDLIIRRCREDNFVSVVPSALGVELQGRVRRLSVSLIGAAEDDDTILQVATSCFRSQVRSLVSFGATKWVPPLSELKFLRVLFLEFPKQLVTMDLTCVGQLSLLRHLKIEPQLWYCSKWGSIVLPSEIRRMQHLERLEIPEISIHNIPSDIVDLPRLSHLILPWNTNVPDRIGKMKSLRTLRSSKYADSSPENIKGLGELNKLESLYLGCTPTAIWMDALIFSLEKLCNLRWLKLAARLNTCYPDLVDALSLLSPPFHNLEELHLYDLTFSRVPKWIGVLQRLRTLAIGATQMPQEDIGVIGALPSLLNLYLRIRGVPTDRVMIGRSAGFKALELFKFHCDAVSYLTFDDGAMPRLRELRLALDSREWDNATPLGLHYLSSLKKITVWVRGQNSEEIGLVRMVFQEATDAHPSSPALFTLQRASNSRLIVEDEEDEEA